MKILIIDDDEINRGLVKNLLLRIFAAAEITTASDGKSGLAYLNSNFSLLITDLTMPGISGKEVIKQSKEKFPDIPAVLMSGDDEVIVRAAVKACGADAFILKPFTQNEFWPVINAVV